MPTVTAATSTGTWLEPPSCLPALPVAPPLLTPDTIPNVGRPSDSDDRLTLMTCPSAQPVRPALPVHLLELTHERMKPGGISSPSSVREGGQEIPHQHLILHLSQEFEKGREPPLQG
ncbi:hypothetical protein D4764_14G0006220 [Takifugu flavidus]|uniref:Uncharacterized protein n=1 Tax=Takifugu flavidus TaxID=433684 RepID=A0A5C6P6P8_9TELE|nr:hypothetical protein D4764_14G0006220 [Takifugu flavidus]